MMNKVLTRLLLMGTLAASFLAANAQDDKSKRPSPPAQVQNVVDGVNVTIDYSQPAVKERKIWGRLVPYDKVWRTGANEASWIELSDDVLVNGKKLEKGKYGLFTLVQEDEWTVIFNDVWDQWGAYNYDESKDVVRIKATPVESDKFYERFTIEISDDGEVSMNWENLSVPFTITKS